MGALGPVGVGRHVAANCGISKKALARTAEWPTSVVVDGSPVITHGTPDLLYSATARVISSIGEEYGISGASQNVSLVDRMESMSWSVAMLSRVLPIAPVVVIIDIPYCMDDNLS